MLNTIIWLVVLKLLMHSAGAHDIVDVDFHDGRTPVYSVRECTTCLREYRDCTNIYFNLFTNYYGTRQWYNDNLEPNPFGISEELVHLSCFPSELPMPGDRKKRSPDLNDDKLILQKRNLPEEDSLGLIYINRMYFGKTPVGAACDAMPSSHDTCHHNGFQEPDMEHFVEFNGQESCVDAAIPQYLSSCNGQTSDFVHIDYQCIDKRRTFRLEDEPEEDEGDLTYFYVRSQNYPSRYPRDEGVTCSVSLRNGDRGKFVLTVLDFHVEDSESCIYDWVELHVLNPDGDIIDWERSCGHVLPGTEIVKRGNEIVLNFKTDSSLQDRGFWIKIEGYDSNDRERNMELKCKYEDPEDFCNVFYYDSHTGQYICDHNYDYSNEWTTATSDSEENEGEEDAGEEEEGDGTNETGGQAARVGDDNGSNSMPIIVGASVGGGLVLIIAVITTVICCRRHGGTQTPQHLEANLQRTKASVDTKNNPYNDNHSVDNPGYIRSSALANTEDVYETISYSGYQPGLVNGTDYPGYTSHVSERPPAKQPPIMPTTGAGDYADVYAIPSTENAAPLSTYENLNHGSQQNNVYLPLRSSQAHDYLEPIANKT